MKKVININFHGRVVPIEETAYDILKQYIDSLRKYFAHEESAEEIVNDIEGRIAELFAEKLKSGLTCITDADVNSIIAEMGRPEDFEAQDADAPSGTGAYASSSTGAPSSGPKKPGTRGPLYRNADDKILAGVCSGLANYLNIDPVIMRILFVALFGALFWVYILLWVIVPSRSVESNITKRLYRNPEQRVIAGVCGGIAAYFNIDVWIPRLIFALPFILALISGSFHAFWWNWDFGWMPRIISGSFGWTMFLTYVVLWISVPYANSSSERLEMRGEKVDVNSIRNTVKEDLENFRSRAEKLGSDVKSSARQMRDQAGTRARNFASEAAPVVKNSVSGLGHALGVIVKAFLIFIFAIIALALFGAFLGILFGGVALAPLKGFVLESPAQNVLAVLTLFLFFMTPLVGLVTWVIRRIVGARSKKHYVGLTFFALWIAGLICGISLIVSVANSFRKDYSLKEEELGSASSAKMYVDVEGSQWKAMNHRFLGMEIDDDDFPFFDISDDSIFLNTVRINMVKSGDSAFHVYRVRSSRGRTTDGAMESAKAINFDVIQHDSTLVLPRGFLVGRNTKFRNQRVRVVIEVPVGRTIAFSEKIRTYNWFHIRNHNGFNSWDDDENEDRDDLHHPYPGRAYTMNADGTVDAIND